MSSKRRHSDDSKSRKSKKSRTNTKDTEKPKETFNPKKEIFTESEEDFEALKATRREYVMRIQMKQSGLNVDERSRNCPYLDSINRNVLDFDFEKLCSISLTHLNVYACLVCGLYYQGRGRNTHAHTHSVDSAHHVFLNLETRRFYCLPDNYEVVDSSLDNITYLLSPTFTKSQMALLDRSTQLVRSYNGHNYYPGIVGLNNIKANDYCNVILQMLSHVKPIRNFFIQESNYAIIKTAATNHSNMLVIRFGELVRKLWNPKNFKTHVSPHEFLQAVVLCSKKQFQFTKQSSAVDFFSWMINSLHSTLTSSNTVSGDKGSIFSKALRGRMKVTSRRVIPDCVSREDRRRLLTSSDYQDQVDHSKFFLLTCDLPPPPLFRDEMRSTEIPQVFLGALLSKFNGVQEKEYKLQHHSVTKRFEIERLPPYIVVCFKRFVSNYIRSEKYPTIVTFPLTNFDWGDLLSADTRRTHKHTVYDLVANVSHEGDLETGVYKAHVRHQATKRWYCMQDLHVDEAFPEMIPLCESIVQVWRVNTAMENPHFVASPTVEKPDNGAKKEPSEDSVPPPPPPPPYVGGL